MTNEALKQALEELDKEFPKDLAPDYPLALSTKLEILKLRQLTRIADGLDEEIKKERRAARLHAAGDAYLAAETAKQESEPK